MRRNSRKGESSLALKHMGSHVVCARRWQGAALQGLLFCMGKEKVMWYNSTGLGIVFTHPGPLCIVARGGGWPKAQYPSFLDNEGHWHEIRGRKERTAEVLITYLLPYKVSTGWLWPWPLHPVSILLGQWTTWLYFLPYIFFCSVVDNSEKPVLAKMSKNRGRCS